MHNKEIIYTIREFLKSRFPKHDLEVNFPSFESVVVFLLNRLNTENPAASTEQLTTFAKIFSERIFPSLCMGFTCGIESRFDGALKSSLSDVNLHLSQPISIQVNSKEAVVCLPNGFNKILY